MQATNKIKNRTKPLQSTQSSISINSSAKSYQVPTITTCDSTLFSRLFNSILGTISPMPQYLEKEQIWLMKEKRCFCCKERNHKAYDCPRKGKIAAILEGLSEGSDSQRKE